jgi:hypothetical protein
MSRPQERLAARQDRHALGRERGNFVDDSEAFLGAELAAIGEVLVPTCGVPPASR